MDSGNTLQQEYINFLRNSMLEQFKKDNIDSDLNQNSQIMNHNNINNNHQDDHFKYNYNKMAQQQGIKKIGSYSIEERAKKIKKYKDKLLRWKQAHPISRQFSGRSQVANKKPRIKGRFVKNDDEENESQEQQMQQNNSSHNLSSTTTYTLQNNQENNNNNNIQNNKSNQIFDSLNTKETQNSNQEIQDLQQIKQEEKMKDNENNENNNSNQNESENENQQQQ
ncbi:hypothetical protein PPERSA_05050 [Pseudocohnilembus persalinus]|uniref:Uncharacterized protein n=1 Tax=Pseudocohnilembus persalinus TaxID=266149 RepID=A0A0V0QX55_PSEPJ|nr:hypothetical protein PPERSA_05050 [Pseudocohnilembus persalinus]|eukprot:KRX06437.1 hypothetical protein PPERSA_05050 [Pseudocohnilembus persalinus]